MGDLSLLPCLVVSYTQILEYFQGLFSGSCSYIINKMEMFQGSFLMNLMGLSNIKQVKVLKLIDY